VEDYMLGALEADLGPGEMLVSVKVPKLSRSARWGYYKSCRKTGEFAHAIGAFLADPDRGVIRVVIGATESRPIVITDAGNIIGDGRAERLDAAFDSHAISEVIEAAGMTNPIDKQTHIVALGRALEQAQSA
jgi:carbon-monoxide dehydrogenase medium subunit